MLRLVAQIFTSWNQIVCWMKQLENLVKAACDHENQWFAGFCPALDAH